MHFFACYQFRHFVSRKVERDKSKTAEDLTPNDKTRGASTKGAPLCCLCVIYLVPLLGLSEYLMQILKYANLILDRKLTKVNRIRILI